MVFFIECEGYHAQSAKLFLQSSELGLPHLLTRRRVCTLHPFGCGGGAHSLAGQGVGESQFGRGDRHCGTLGIYLICGTMGQLPHPLGHIADCFQMVRFGRVVLKVALLFNED